MRLAILTSHPVQNQAPFFRAIAKRMDAIVFFAHAATPQEQADAGFQTPFEWDVDLLSGYEHEFLLNTARDPSTHHFAGCDNPEIGARLARAKCEALLVTGWHLKCYWQATAAAKRRAVPVMVRGDSHLDTPRTTAVRGIKDLMYPPLLRLFNAALYVGKRNFDYWRHYNYPERRLSFSPHCVDIRHFSSRATAQVRRTTRDRLGISENASVALFAGKLIKRKRPSDLVAAASLVRRQGVDLQILVAGSGSLEPALREQARQEAVPIQFLGFQNQSEMPAAYAASDVLVLPSDIETWGLVANEALACARPIIVSDAVGCAPDLTADPGVGLSFPVGQVEALAEALTRLLSQAPNERAFDAINQRFSPEGAAGGVEQACAFMLAARDV